MHKFTLEGRVKIASGRMLIIDPGYLEKNIIDEGVFGELFEPNLDNRRRMSKRAEKAREKRIKAIDKLGNEVEYALNIAQPKLIDPEIPETEKKKISAELKKKTSAYHHRIMEASTELLKVLRERHFPQKGPRFYPPYVVQFPNYVLFCNRIGDGHYPVVQTARSRYIIFNVPIKPKDKKSFEVDLSRLEGKVLGWSSVDGGVQIVADAEKSAKPKIDLSPNSYSVLEVPKGNYCCRFVDNGWKLSIKRQK